MKTSVIPVYTSSLVQIMCCKKMFAEKCVGLFWKRKCNWFSKSKPSRNHELSFNMCHKSLFLIVFYFDFESRSRFNVFLVWSGDCDLSLKVKRWCSEMSLLPEGSVEGLMLFFFFFLKSVCECFSLDLKRASGGEWSLGLALLNRVGTAACS